MKAPRVHGHDDPLSDVIATLGPRTVRCTRFEGSGPWAFAFPELDRLKFVAMLRGRQWITLPDRPPVEIVEGDVFLMGRSPFTIASDLSVPPADGALLYADGDTAYVGGADVVAIGGNVAFASSAANFLFEALPDLMPIQSSSRSADAVKRLLELLETEMNDARSGRTLISRRLAEILMVEGLRSAPLQDERFGQSWLRALADPKIGAALSLMHSQIARSWSVAELASKVGMSRSAFAARFTDRVGRPPLDYLRYWRMTVARAALDEGHRDIGVLADCLGYASQSAFTVAFRRQFDCSPTGLGCPDSG